MNLQLESNLKPIRVLIFDHVATLSGGEIALLNLVRAFDRNRVDPIVVLGEHGPLETLLRVHVEVHVLLLNPQLKDARRDALGGGVGGGGLVLGAGLYVWRLARLISKLRVDLVHTNSLKGHFLGGLAARLSRTPLIWHVRDRITPDYLPAKVVSSVRFIARWLPNVILTNSLATASTLGTACESRIKVVHDGVVVDQFNSLPAPFPPSRPSTIGLLGRISPWKGQDIFVLAAKIVVTKFPDTVFQIIGAPMFDEVEFERKLHERVAELQLGDSIIFTGFKHDVRDAIALLDIVVHASTIPEPFGQVIIEGMAAARPVIAVNAGAVPEIIEDGVSGCLFRMGDPEDLARAIIHLMNNRPDAIFMGINGQKRAADRFNIAKTASGVTLAYSRLVPTR